MQAEFQRTATRLLTPGRREDLEPWVRHKMERWQVPQFPRIRVANCLTFLQVLGTRVPPRVWAATWRALWNGWATSRRTQRREGLPGCMFRCSEYAQDSIEHYSSCVSLHAITSAELGLPRAPTPGERLAAFLGLDFSARDRPDEAVRRALRLAAVYRTHCLCRHCLLRRAPATAEAMKQACREAVRGHRGAARVYDAAQRRLGDDFHVA